MDSSITAPSTKSKGGFDCEFEIEPKELQSKCSICLLVLREPHLTSCCGYSFCQGCIEKIAASPSPECPLCRKEFHIYPNKWLKRELNQLKVYCTHRNEGCEWAGPLEQLDEHLNPNTDMNDLTTGCGYVSIKCDACGDNVLRKGYGVHMSDLCNERPYSCVHCGEYNSTYLDVINNHWPQCPYYPVECTNKCGKHTIKRKDLAQHLFAECPHTSVPCEFCSAQIKREEMHKHIAENLKTHILLMVDPLHDKMGLLSEQADDAKEKIRMLADDNQYLQGEVERLCLCTGKNEKEIHHLRQDNLETQSLYSEMHQRYSELMQSYESLQRDYEGLKRDNEVLHERVSQLSVDLAKFKLTSQKFSSSETYRYDPVPAKPFVYDSDHSGTTYYEEFDTSSDLELSQASATGYRYSQDLDLQQHPPILSPPVKLIMSNYATYSSGRNRGKFWVSKPFYSGIQPSYRLCLSIKASTGRDPVSVHVRLMRGKFDDQLKWPFNADITIKLINHGRGKDWVKTIFYGNGRRVTEGKVARGGQGINFITLYDGSSFIKNDALWFEVVDVQLT